MEQKVGFVSMRRNWASAKTVSNGRTKREASGITDPYLASMLNDDGIVQVGDYIYKIDVNNEKVYALKAADEAYIAELRKEKPQNEKIRVFSTNDEVLNIVDAEQTGGTVSPSFLCIRESGASGNKATVLDDYSTGIYTYRADIKHVYQKAGIYFSLMSEMKYMRDDEDWVWHQYSTQITLRVEYKYRRKCGNTEIFSPVPYEEITVIDNKLNRRIWESTDALHKYWLKSTYIYERKDLTGPTPVFQTITDPQLPIIQSNY